MLVDLKKQNRVQDQGSTKCLSILGSTGSIGQSTLEVIRQHPNSFEVRALAAGSDIEKLSRQVIEFQPELVALADASRLSDLVSLCRGKVPESTRFVGGDEGVLEAASIAGSDTVVVALVGIKALATVLEALKLGKRVALANKECVVAGGALLQSALQQEGAGEIVPIDSEHSSIFQLLQGQQMRDVSKITLTASGGPFLDTPLSDLEHVTPDQAIKHPRWQMGAKISVDSATMMNKALEVIEAHWLFGFERQKIEVIIHPQSIVHALISLNDGSVLAHLSVPDMRAAIAYSLSYPGSRLIEVVPSLDLTKLAALEFRPLDKARFPAVNLAYRCIENGGSACAVMNIANEVAVDAFLSGRLKYNCIIELVQSAVESHNSAKIYNVDDLIQLQASVSTGLSRSIPGIITHASF